MSSGEPRRAALSYLVAACRRWLGDRLRDPADRGGTEPPTAALEAETVATLGRLASLHNLEPLLYHLADRGRLLTRDLPSGLLARWEAAYHHNAIFQAELFERLARVLDGCARRGVRIAVFKGPVTAIRGWGDPALRQMADLDLLVAGGDLAAAGAAAAEAGFAPADQTSDYHLALRHRRLPAGLELHHRLYDVVARPRELLDAVWERLETVTLDGLRVPAPAPAEAAALDVAHLVQHDLELNLRPLVDLAATGAAGRAGVEGFEPALEERLERADLLHEFGLLTAILEHHLGWPGASAAGTSPPPTALARRLDRTLLAPERHLGRPFGGPHRKGGARATAGYLMRQLFPRPSRLAALSGSEGVAAGLARWPGHVLAVFGRFRSLSRAAAGRSDDPAGSIKAALHRRRAGGG